MKLKYTIRVMIALCPLCGDRRAKEFLRCEDHFGTKEIFTISRCQGCSFLYTSDEPGPENITKYYATGLYTPLLDQLPLHIALVRRVRHRMAAKMVERTAGRKNGVILDIGCGAGGFLRAMRRRGWEVRGIERDEACRKRINSQGISVLSPDEIGTISDASADVITLFHVLEHVHGLANIGKEIRRILKPGGTCVIAVPNAEALDARIYGVYWPGYDVPRHLYHFSRATLTKFSHQSGFKVVSFGSMPFDSFYGCIKGEKYRKGYVLRGLLRAAISIAWSTFHRRSSATILIVLSPASKLPSLTP